MQIKPLTTKQAEAIMALHNNEDFKVFMDYVATFNEDIVRALMQNPKLEAPEYVRGEGGGITQILEKVAEAPTTFEKLRNQT